MIPATSGMAQRVLAALAVLAMATFPAATAAHDVSSADGEEVRNFCRASGGVWDGGCYCPEGTTYEHLRCESRAAMCGHRHGAHTEYVVKKGYIDCYCIEGYKKDYSAPGWWTCVADGSYRGENKPEEQRPAAAEAAPSCGNHARLINGKCACEPGYTIYTATLGCEPVYCGEAARFDLQANRCVCREGYVVGKDGQCLSMQRAREEQQKALEAERDKALQAEKEKARQAELQAERAYLNRLLGNGEQRIRELERLLGIRQPLGAETVEAVAYQATYRNLAALQKQNQAVREMMLAVGDYREIAKDVQAAVASANQKLVADYREAKRLLDADDAEPSAAPAELKKRLDAPGKGLLRRSYDWLLNSAPAEEQESSWWQRAADGTAALAEFSAKHGLMESESAEKLTWRAGLAKDLGEGNWFDATATLAREGLNNYLKNEGHYKEFVEKWLGRVDWVAEQGEKVKKLTENLSEKVNLAREVAETYERVNKYERVFAGNAAESATALTLGGKIAGKIADHTLGKIPYGGKVIAEGAKTYLEAPGKLVDAVAQIQEKRLQIIDESEVGMDMTGSSEVVEFLRSNAEHRVEEVAPGNQAAGQRISYTLDYVVDGEKKTKTYNMNLDRWVKNEKTGFIVPLQGTDGNVIDGELQFRPVDNRTLLIFGCVEMEIWTTDDPPRQILPTPCISK